MLPMFISSMEDIKVPTHYLKRVRQEVPGVLVVLCECIGRYREGDIPCMGLRVLFVQYMTLHFRAKTVEKEKQRAHHLILSIHLSVHQYQH